MSTPSNWKARGPMVVGLIALVVLVGGLGVWSVQARIAGAVIAPGLIQLESNRQIVQHPDGGVVGAILARDGDTVEAGQILIRFDGARLLSELAIVEGQLAEITARALRLRAERDGLDEIEVPDDLRAAMADSPRLADQINGEISFFEARQEARGQEAGQLREQIIQIDNRVTGTQAQLTALARQIELIGSELTDQQALLDRGLTQASRVTSLQREEARLMGEIGNLEAGVAELLGRKAELNISLLRQDTQRREEAISTLRELEFAGIELEERRGSLRETLSRLEVTAPVSGIVYESSVFALQSVVQPAQPILYIIPQDQPLVIGARVDAIHIDQVFPGQSASLRFTALDMRRTPEVEGRVLRVSADVIVDEVTRASYYAVDLLPVDATLPALGDQVLLPGMPVEAFIQTGERAPLTYLTKPLTDYFTRAFRE